MKIPVSASCGSYTIYLNEKKDFVELFHELFPDYTYCIVVTNDTLEKMYQKTIIEWEKRLGCKRYVIKDGESYKSSDTVLKILDFLIGSHFDRGTVLLAFGGGVIGDITGLVASLFLRGVRYVQIPTTLLSMVDSSVGGKNGINHRCGKNLIGTIHQPSFVWMETAFLDTLPTRDYIAGSAEVFKCAFIGGRFLFDYLSKNAQDILSYDRYRDKIQEVVSYSLSVKVGIVTEDERETGKRSLLNFGHTFGHALEQFFQYERILHGEAVFWGIRCAVALAEKTGFIREYDKHIFDDFCRKLPLPQLPCKPDPERIHEMMFSDKKVNAGKLRFVLPTEPGVSVISDTIGKRDILSVVS